MRGAHITSLIRLDAWRPEVDHFHADAAKHQHLQSIQRIQSIHGRNVSHRAVPIQLQRNARRLPCQVNSHTPEFDALVVP